MTIVARILHVITRGAQQRSRVCYSLSRPSLLGNIRFSYQLIVHLLINRLINRLCFIISVWRVGHVYEFDYQGFVGTGMQALSRKLAGGSISGRLIVEVVDETTLNVAVSL